MELQVIGPSRGYSNVGCALRTKLHDVVSFSSIWCTECTLPAEASTSKHRPSKVLEVEASAGTTNQTSGSI